MMTIDLQALSLVERRDGFVWLQPQPYGKDGTGVAYEAVPPFGLMGRPRGPTDKAPTGIVFRHGPEGFVIASTDPRYQDLLPDLGEGGAGIYGTIEQSGSKVPYVGIFGADGAAPEGTVRASCLSPVGESKVEIDPSTGDVTVTHAGGTVVVVKAASVELGAASGNFPLVRETGALATFFGSVVLALGALGQTVTAPAGYTCTKVNGT